MLAGNISQQPIDPAEFYKECLAISNKKSIDYTGGEDVFANFTAPSNLGIDPVDGFLTRMMDKVMRIASYIKRGEFSVEDEGPKDTLQDLANYACLLDGYLSEKTDGVYATGAAEKPKL